MEGRALIRLSIITTLYRTAAYLPKCVESLLDQDIPASDYEIVLVNDGSPENDLEIASSYAERHPNVKVISQANKGLAGARNTGLAAASGRYVCFVDPDDYVRPCSLKHLLDRMDEADLDVLRFDYQMVDEQYNPLDKPGDAQLIDYAPGIYDGRTYLAERQGFACFVWAFIYRSSVIKDNGISFREGDYFDDTAWLPRVLCAAERVDTVPDVRYFYLQRGNSLVNASSPEALKKKLDAQLVLVGRLQEGLARSEGPVRKWYEGMIAKITLSTLTSAASGMRSECGEYVKRLTSFGVFPLKPYLTTKRQKLKYFALNLSPELFCRAYALVNG